MLKTIPWTKVNIKVFLVEHNNMKGGKDALIDFMTSKGYTSLPFEIFFRRISCLLRTD